MYQYSFANVDLNLRIPDAGGTYEELKVTGFAAGENLINIARRAPIANTMFGAYGDMVVSMQRILAGDLTFPVLMNAPENKKLQDWANYFQAQADSDGELIFPIQATMVDNMGKDVATMVNGVILAMPAMIRGQVMNTVTWVLTFESVKFTREPGADLVSLGE
jgi:hypothetical protein